jgi:predicted amino acid dehydrogenase
MVAPKIEKLKNLKSAIKQEIAGAHIENAPKAGSYAFECQAIITTTSAFGQHVLDVSTLAPGAVVCDIARPSDISEEEAALRPDVCVLESGEVYILPASRQVDIGYNIGLPKGASYACLGETALLAMCWRAGLKVSHSVVIFPLPSCKK